MAASSRAPESPDAPVLRALASFLDTHRPDHILLACSGGLDSSVLLHGLARLRHDFGFELAALHVHHGLSRQADVWARHCVEAARKLGVRCEVVRVRLDARADSIEAEARRLRYAALARHARQWVLTAHHQRDQAETVLLNLLRGSGLNGLCGMAPVRVLSGPVHLGRPLLSVPHAALVDYARHVGLQWVEDESNRQLVFRRNWVRHRLLPIILERFPAVERTLAQTASHLRESRRLLEQLAKQDLAVCTVSGGLACDRLLALSPERRRNLLRYWFEQHHGMVLTRNHLDGLERLLHAQEGRQPELFIGSHVATRFQNRLIYPKTQLPDWTPCRWHARDRLPFRFEGVLAEDTLLVPLRQTGLSIKPYKKAFQAAGVPPWQRPCWPVACRDGEPAWILGVGSVRGTKAWPEAARVQVAPKDAIG